MGASLAVTLLMLIICTNTVITDGKENRPQGFQGSRGKRSITQSSEEDPENNHQKLVVTTTEKNYREDELRSPDLLRVLAPVSVVKRAPMGFMGMRGKKEYDFVDLGQVGNSFAMQGNDHLYYPKRAPSGFMGMRGKKLYADNYYDAAVGDKRAPSGFMGMRGKKENDFISNELRYLEDQKNADNQIFAELLRQYYEAVDGSPIQLLDDNDGGFEDGGGGGSKRAPSAGFFGMRGKRYFDLMDDAQQDKRAPSAGFFGMRGKKWVEDGNALDDDDEFLQGEEKRAPSVGFHGMRGKKDVSNVMEQYDEKRAPSGGFFGMRGKKVPSGFFGTRGKKGPFEFRGKFVGVRGKKVPAGSIRNLAMNLGEYTMPEMQSARLIPNEFESNKRAPSGFQGMRGKKWAGSGPDRFRNIEEICLVAETEC